MARIFVWTYLKHLQQLRTATRYALATSSLDGQYKFISYNGCHRPIRQYATRSNATKKEFDVIVIGAGVVGLATARELIMRFPSLNYAVLDKESKIAMHQSGHNSGVIHAGIYYVPGSLKAKLCTEGLRLSYQFCDEHKIPYKKCGKLIVAVEPRELPLLDDLYERGLKNDVPGLKLIGQHEIKDIEPHCKGLKAIHSPHTGIVDWAEMTRAYGSHFEKQGGHIFLSQEVKEFRSSTAGSDYPVVVVSRNNVSNHEDEFCAKYVIVCGGLYADRLAAKSGCDPFPKIVPFRGEYLLLNSDKLNLVNGNIYPVPDPKFPFLGVHFTPRINGEVWLGPNAILAFHREGYKLLNVNLRDIADQASFWGLWKLIFRNSSYAIGEFYRGLSLSAQVKQLQRFVPELKVSDCSRGPSGVRAQAVDKDGKLVDDFIFDDGKGDIGSRMLHVRNAPSPGATSSLAIAKMIADEAKKRFKL